MKGPDPWNGRRLEMVELYKRMRVTFPERSQALKNFVASGRAIRGIRREGEDLPNFDVRLENLFDNLDRSDRKSVVTTDYTYWREIAGEMYGQVEWIAQLESPPEFEFQEVVDRIEKGYTGALLKKVRAHPPPGARQILGRWDAFKHETGEWWTGKGPRISQGTVESLLDDLVALLHLPTE